MPAVVDKGGKESIRIPSKLHVGRANVFFGQETEKLIAIDGGSIEVLHRRGKNKGLPRGNLKYTVIIHYIQILFSSQAVPFSGIFFNELASTQFDF